jgi:hypothetical protein
MFCLAERRGEHARLIGSRFATEEALREIHRILRPGGAFGVIWNIEDCEPLTYSILSRVNLA